MNTNPNRWYRARRWARRSSALLLVGGFLLAGATAALAYWTVSVIYAPTNYAIAQAATVSAPTTPTATVNGSGSITIGWTLPGTQLAGAQYQVTRTSPAGTVCTVASTATSCTDTGLTAGTAYVYSIAAVLGTNWQSSAITTSATTKTPTLTIVLSSGPYTAGSPITVQSVTAKILGVTDSTYNGTKTITWSGLATSPSGQAAAYPTSSVTFVNGVASPSAAFTAYAAGSNTLVGTDAAASSVTGSVSFTVTYGTATQIVLSGSTTNLASAATRLLTATIEDAAGNTVTGGVDSTDSVTFSKTAGSGAGTVSGMGASAAVAGVATDTVTGALAGPLTTQASATVNGSGVTSNTIGFTVTFGTATHVVLSGSTATLASGTTRVLTATIEDAAGNTVTSGADSTDTVTFSKTAGSGAGTISGLTSPAAVAGVATDTVTGALAGPLTTQASATVNGSGVTSNTIGFTVTLGTATQIVLSGSTANLASGATRVLTATIEDAAGNTVTGGSDATDSVTFSKTAGSGAGTVSGLTSAAAVAGVATDTVTGVLAGPLTTQASATVNGSATSSNTIGFTVTAGAASALVFTNCSVNGGATVSSCPSTVSGLGNGPSHVDAFVSVVDAGGNPATVPAGTTWTVSVTGTNPTRFTVTGSPVTITGPATQSGTSFRVTFSGTSNSSTTITAQATAGPTVTNGTMMVTK
jgi:hypothetical protein